jgi:hypothetical protein
MSRLEDAIRCLTLCAVCGDPFDPAEWDDRHSDEAGEDIHAHCCTACVTTA